MNKDKAMQMLKAKLYLLKQEENAAKEAGIRGEVKEIGEARYVRMCFSLTPWSRITGQMWRPVMRMQCSMAI